MISFVKLHVIETLIRAAAIKKLLMRTRFCDETVLKDDDEWVRGRAAEALGKISGSDANRALGKFREEQIQIGTFASQRQRNRPANPRSRPGNHRLFATNNSQWKLPCV